MERSEFAALSNNGWCHRCMNYHDLTQCNAVIDCDGHWIDESKRTSDWPHPSALGIKVMAKVPDSEKERLERELKDLRDHLAGAQNVEQAKSQYVLDEASAIVRGAREAAYGHPRDDFARIANLWNAYLISRGDREDYTLKAEDVSLMMILLKMARLIETPAHRDSIVDIAGYAACLARVTGLEP